MKPSLLPWHQKCWSTLGLETDRKAHALLFGGPSGTGKRALALLLGIYRLCEAPSDHRPCGICRQCTLVESGSHPDLHVLLPEVDLEEGDPLAMAGRRYRPEKTSEAAKPKRGIVVDQVRRLSAALSTHPKMASVRVVVVAPAETMNLNAANAFLKLLEEPPDNTQLILVTANTSSLLPTLRSRCSPVEMPLPTLEEGIQWLEGQGIERSQGERLLMATDRQPLTALHWSNNNWIELRGELYSLLLQMLKGERPPLEVANRLSKVDPAMLIHWITRYIEAMIRSTLLGDEEEGAVATPSKTHGKQWSPQFAIDLFGLHDHLLSLLAQLEGPGGVDGQLMVEDSLLMLNCIKRQ